MKTITKASHLMKNNQSEEALKLLDEYLPTTTDDKKYTIAEFYMEWGFFHEALIILQELLQKYPSETDIKILLANIYVEIEDEQQAIDLLNDIPNSDDLYGQVLLLLADLYQVQGLFEVAERKLLEAKKIHPNESVIDFALGEFFFSIGQYKKAITCYEKMLPEITELADISIYARLGEAYASIGEYEKALSIFQQDDSENPDTLFKFGFTAYYASRKDIAINIWKKVIELDENYHTVYYELAKAYFEEEFIEEAYEIAKQGLKVDEFNKELYYFAGMLSYKLQKNEESETLLRQAIILDPDYQEAILLLVEQLKQREDYREIVSLIEEGKRLGAIDPLYNWELARAHEALEDYDKAGKSYQDAYAQLNEDSDFLKEYGYFKAEEGKVDDAHSILEKYLKLEPSDTDTIEYVERMRESMEI